MAVDTDLGASDSDLGKALVPRPYRAPERTSRPFRLPRSLDRAAIALLDGVGGGENASIAIAVRLVDHDLSVRGLAAYLAFADRVYARFTAGSLERYRRSKSQLRIAETRHGSLILVLREALETVLSAQGLALTALVLKYLPGVVKAPAAAYRDYQEGRFRRAERKRLTQRTETDAALKQLPTGEFKRVVAAMLEAYEKEESRLPAAQEFSVRTVEDVRLEVVEAGRPREHSNAAKRPSASRKSKQRKPRRST